MPTASQSAMPRVLTLAFRAVLHELGFARAVQNSPTTLEKVEVELASYRIAAATAEHARKNVALAATLNRPDIHAHWKSELVKCEAVFGEKHAALVAAKERVGSDAFDRVATTLAPSNFSVRRYQTTLAARPVPAFAFDGTVGAGSRKQQLQQALADAVRGADDARAGGEVGAVRVERLVDEDDEAGVVTTPLGVTMRRPGDVARPPASEPVAAMLVRLGVRSAAAPSAPAAPSPPPPPPPEAAAAAPTAEEEMAAEQDGGGDVRMGAAPPPPQTEADEDPLLAPPREQHAQRAPWDHGGELCDTRERPVNRTVLSKMLFPSRARARSSERPSALREARVYDVMHVGLGAVTETTRGWRQR